eukprot:scaffold244126_cov30-Tisochrysis_lutea.AAC.4
MAAASSMGKPPRAAAERIHRSSAPSEPAVSMRSFTLSIPHTEPGNLLLPHSRTHSARTSASGA